MEQWNKLVGLVKEFYIAFGQEKYFCYEKMNLSEMFERVNLRNKLLIEEAEEYIKAEAENNKVEMLDAICDMNYIYLGTLLEKNNGDIDTVVKDIFFEGDKIFEKIWAEIDKNKFDKIFCEAFEEVHRSNMSKLKNGKAIFREDGKILKGKNYFPPNLKQFIE